jgi:hypothetical protein
LESSKSLVHVENANSETYEDVAMGYDKALLQFGMRLRAQVLYKLVVLVIEL